MKRLFYAAYIGLVATVLGACGQKAATDTAASANTQAAAPAAQRVKIEVTDMSAADVEAKFNLGVDSKMRYKGFYEATKDAQGKETLDGKFELISNDDRKKYEDPEQPEKMMSYYIVGYKGNYAAGKKEGDFICVETYHEAGFNTILTFKADVCEKVLHHGSSESLCFFYEGKPKAPKFGQALPENVEVDCEKVPANLKLEQYERY